MSDELLKSNNLKITENRRLVLSVLESCHEPMTADQIFQEVASQKSLDYSTVYRILSVFTGKHITCKSIGGDGVAYYQFNHEGHNHSHYIVCSGCHKRVVVEDCPLEEVSKKLVEQTGFTITGHNLEFVGECPDCVKKHSV